MLSKIEFRLNPERERDRAISEWLESKGERERSVYARDALWRGICAGESGPGFMAPIKKESHITHLPQPYMAKNGLSNDDDLERKIKALAERF